jgi:hypothetical protein
MHLMNIPRVATVVAGLALGACASDPLYVAPAQETIEDYVIASQLQDVDLIRKTDRDSWQYVNDRYIIYRGRPNEYLIEFSHGCDSLDDNGRLPPIDIIHDHRNIRPTDTIRGCIVDRIYAISSNQRRELRQLGQPAG